MNMTYDEISQVQHQRILSFKECIVGSFNFLQDGVLLSITESNSSPGESVGGASGLEED